HLHHVHHRHLVRRKHWLSGFRQQYSVSGLHVDLETSLSGFPIDLFITFVGLTYLFGFTQNNGAIDVLGRSCMADRRRPKLSRVSVCCSCSSFRIRKLTSFTPCLNGSCRCSTKTPELSEKRRAVMLTSAARRVAERSLACLLALARSARATPCL